MNVVLRPHPSHPPPPYSHPSKLQESNASPGRVLSHRSILLWQYEYHSVVFTTWTHSVHRVQRYFGLTIVFSCFSSWFIFSSLFAFVLYAQPSPTRPFDVSVSSIRLQMELIRLRSTSTFSQVRPRPLHALSTFFVCQKPQRFNFLKLVFYHKLFRESDCLERQISWS